ncbi:MAG TPA: GyrI-like domain-containing protein [Bacteroidales bacterium]
MKTKMSVTGICIALAVMLNTPFKVTAQSSPTTPKIEVKEVNAQKALTIKVSVPTNTIGQKMGELYGKLFGHLGENSLQPAGAPFAVYYSFDPNGNTEFEVGVPVSTETKGTDEIKYKEYPAMKVISTLYVGPYEKMGPVYEALKKYAADNKLETQPATWEVYLTDPMKETDTSKYQTLIYYVIK